jgi:pre-mRNA-splicing factor ISY1
MSTSCVVCLSDIGLDGFVTVSRSIMLFGVYNVTFFVYLICPVSKPKTKTRFELHKSVDAEYYGFNDDDDAMLCKLEAEAEQKGRLGLFRCSRLCIHACMHVCMHACVCVYVCSLVCCSATYHVVLEKSPNSILSHIARAEAEAEWKENEDNTNAARDAAMESTLSSTKRFRAHVPLPSDEAIQAQILAKRKQELLQRLQKK